MVPWKLSGGGDHVSLVIKSFSQVTDISKFSRYSCVPIVRKSKKESMIGKWSIILSLNSKGSKFPINSLVGAPGDHVSLVIVRLRI